jgi:hypothetical protein
MNNSECVENKLNFKEFLYNEEISDLDIVSSYFNNNETVRDLCKKTGKSAGCIYRMIHNHGKPDRRSRKSTMRNLALHLADSGLSHDLISNITGYTTRHIRNIIK